MKFLIVAAALLAVAIAAKLGPSDPIAILSSSSFQSDDGRYFFAFETGDGIKRQETGAQKKIGEEFGATSQGTISWKTPDGKTVFLTFVADENGYQPKVTIT